MERTGPNRLLGIIILFSVALHGLVFIHASGIYHRSTTPVAIELSLQNIEWPAARNVPRPPLRSKPPDSRALMKRLNVVQRPLPQFKPLALAPIESHLPETLVEEFDAPEISQVPEVDSAESVPDSHENEVTGEFMTAAGYLDMVRLKIESRRHYPETSKTRSLEGRVTIHPIFRQTTRCCGTWS